MHTHLLADYNAAQASGHHVDCDGYRTAHRTHIMPSGYGTFIAHCDECGALHLGSYGQRSDAVRLHSGHAREVACDGRCRDWS